MERWLAPRLKVNSRSPDGFPMTLLTSNGRDRIGAGLFDINNNNVTVDIRNSLHSLSPRFLGMGFCRRIFDAWGRPGGEADPKVAVGRDCFPDDLGRIRRNLKRWKLELGEVGKMEVARVIIRLTDCRQLPNARWQRLRAYYRKLVVTKC